MAEQELDRSEEATPFKRQDARKKGTVARSQDTAAAVTAAGLLITIVFFGGDMMRAELELFQSFWLRPMSWSFDATQVGGALGTLLWEALVILTPLWLTLIALALLSGASQVGIVISAEPLKPDWKRLNPVQGFKRLISWRMLFEGVKTTLKFSLFVLVLYWAVLSLWPKLLPLQLSNVSGIAQAMGAGSQSIVTRMLAAMILIAGIDWIYARREVGKKLRMSRREVRDEAKRREGDPRIKAKLREIRMQFLQKTQSVGKVKDADVLIVNPQHLAVAIKYQREDMMAPQILSKGAGELALKMKEVARRAGIPVLENKPLARALFREAKIDDWVPEAHYAAVATGVSFEQTLQHSDGEQRSMSTLMVDIRAIDTLLTLGKGQRISIMAGSGVGKSTLLGMLVRNSVADVIVVALIGERGREVLDFIERSLGAEGLARSVVVVATADEPALMREAAALSAMTIAEHFRDQGKHVLLLMDSLTRFAMARREVGLAVGEPATSRGYTPSVFSELSCLLERCGTQQGGGSITGLFTVLVEGDDIHDPIADSVRAIVDGHIVLTRELANHGHFPAIDILGSVSRLMSDLADSNAAALAKKVRQTISVLTKNKDLVDLGAYRHGSNPALDDALSKNAQLDHFLQQDVKEQVSRQIALKQLNELIGQSPSANF